MPRIEGGEQEISEVSERVTYDWECIETDASDPTQDKLRHPAAEYCASALLECPIEGKDPSKADGPVHRAKVYIYGGIMPSGEICRDMSCFDLCAKKWVNPISSEEEENEAAPPQVHKRKRAGGEHHSEESKQHAHNEWVKLRGAVKTAALAGTYSELRHERKLNVDTRKPRARLHPCVAGAGDHLVYMFGGKGRPVRRYSNERRKGRITRRLRYETPLFGDLHVYDTVTGVWYDLRRQARQHFERNPANPRPRFGASLVWTSIALKEPIKEAQEVQEQQTVPDTPDSGISEMDKGASERYSLDDRMLMHRIQDGLLDNCKAEGNLILYGGCIHPHHARNHPVSQPSVVRTTSRAAVVPSSTAWRFCCTELRWMPIHATGTPPPATSHHSAVMVGSSMFVFGGLTEHEFSLSALHELEYTFDESTGGVAWTWKRIQLTPSSPLSPLPCVFASLVQHPSPRERSLLVYGGEGSNISPHVAYRFDLVKRRWQMPLNLQNSPTQRSAFVAASSCFGYNVWIWGGVRAGMEEYREGARDVEFSYNLDLSPALEMSKDDLNMLNLGVELRDHVAHSLSALPPLTRPMSNSVKRSFIGMQQNRRELARELNEFCKVPASRMYRTTKTTIQKKRRTRNNFVGVTHEMANAIMGRPFSVDNRVGRSREAVPLEATQSFTQSLPSTRASMRPTMKSLPVSPMALPMTSPMTSPMADDSSPSPSKERRSRLQKERHRAATAGMPLEWRRRPKLMTADHSSRPRLYITRSRRTSLFECTVRPVTPLSINSRLRNEIQDGVRKRIGPSASMPAL